MQSEFTLIRFCMCEWKPLGILRLCFLEMTVHRASMTHGDPSTHRPPGSCSISQSHLNFFPSSRNADALTLWRTKVSTEAVFSKGFPLNDRCPKIPKQTVNWQLTFSAVTWRKITETATEIQLQVWCFYARRCCLHKPAPLQCNFSMIGCNRAG